MAKKIQPVWAIDIGQFALKALKLIPGEDPDKFHAEAFDYIEYPKILSQPDADAEELIREALATFLSRPENDVKGCKVALAVSGQAGLVKFIKLPPVEKKRIPDIVKFEARQQIPFALEEVIWDYQQIGGDEDEGEDVGFTLAEVGLFAMKRDQIHRAMLPLKNAGIEVDLVQMGPIALYNFASVDRRAPKEEQQNSAVVYVDIGADNSDLIITDGSRIWQRNVPIGGNHFTRALTKELKLTFAKAELLKRNATKAADPRAVFTAMRGVFNDFSSEINRSIGFYSSTNRTTKIAKVVGLGNGFKLPGLQKFLQQNLSYEVEKLEMFERLVGDEVVNAPQFVENLPSFAIAYGLAAQGLGKAPMRTNLLPPEIEQVRMVRRKKPWALAASTLFLLAFCLLFMADWHAWSKATSPEFSKAVNDAKAAASTGSTLKTAYEKAKADFEAQNKRGQALVDDSANSEDWPLLLKLVNSAIPDPARELKKDADKPENFDFLSRLAVHIDSVVPRWRENVDTGWFNDLDAVSRPAKETMHVYDRTTTPTGSGWIIQVVGHHYNPAKDSKKYPNKDENSYNLGPSRYIQYKILPRFWEPRLRAMGIHHAAITWMSEPDRAWTTEKGVGRNILAVMLPPEKPKSATGTASTSTSNRSSAGFAAANPGAMAGMSGGAMGMSMDSMMGSMGMGSSMPIGGRAGAMGDGGTEKAPELKTLTRTDFKIDFIWQPPLPGAKPEDLAEIAKKLNEAVSKSKGAVSIDIDEAALTKASTEATARELDKRGAAAPTAPPTPPQAAPPAPK